MSTTIDELTLYLAKINKFSNFKKVTDLPQETQDEVIGMIKYSIVQCEDHLNHPNITMPEAFRKEFEERRDRCKKWLEEGIENLYCEQSTVDVPTKSGEPVEKRVDYVISFSEA